LSRHLTYYLQLFTRAASMQFTHSVYNATIYENSAAKTYLESHTKMGIFVTDPTWEIRYKIISGDNENLFKAEDYLLGDFSFLRIRTKGGSTAILNREVKDHYMLTVKATERNTNVECRTRVKVQVLDTNDLRPLFSPTSYSISLPENMAIRSSVAKVMATDADIGTNGEYYYSFREWTDMFAVHPTSGVVTLTGKLDYSETKLYELEILAVDRGMKLYGSSGFSSMAKLTVRVKQANEHAPVITAVTLSPSDSDHDPTYAVVTVEDKDLGPNGEISSLSVVAGDPLQQFKAVRSSPGSKEYKIKAVKEVDWDSQPFGYNLTLQAKDKGTPPQFSSAKLVHITSAEFQKGPPVFEKAVYRVNLSEFAPLHTPVMMVTAVPRYPHQNYAFKHSSDKNRFSINADTGLISTAGPINADISAQYEIEVITSDKKAATKVIVDVIDVNNNAPEFQQTSYKASVDENVPIGTSVVAVKATDLDKEENGYVTYSITNLSPQPFVIDYFSGVISTSEVLDYELMPRIYNLKVRASDWGSPFRREVEASVTITLNNLNDNKPLFENIDCEVTVPRDHGVGEQITTASAIDADELQLVRYFIKSGNDLDLFEMNPNSGLLSLKRTLGEGEAAKVSFHSLQIAATDGEHETQPMTMNITVITARKPVQVRCVETGVATMLAEKLLQGSKIHGQTEPEDNYMDIYSVNRYSPLFDESFPSFVEVREDLPVGARVIHLSATDPDSGFNGKLVYVISGGDTESRFIVDMETGWLLVYSPLDREMTDHYTLNITVYDLGIPQKSSSRLLDMKILDANDNSPQFLKDSYSIEISESTPVGTEIIQVDSTDRDQADNGIVKYSILGGTDHFAINEITGVVSVTKPLDRERYPFYVLKIAARDQAVSEPQLVSTVPLKITLEDVNDNPPKFVPPNYRVKVREDLPIGTVIMWLEAHDPDVGASSQVRYSLTDNGDGHFEVDKLSGALRIVQNLDYETKQMYNLTAKAKDKGKPISLSSTCFIEVEVVDVNENLYRPFFRSFVEKGFIKEDSLIGTSVMTVSAEDEDSGRDGEIRYSIRDGSGLGFFSIDEETGVIRTQELLDHETTPHYWLTVYAMDRGVVPLSAFVEVYIEVQDVNDNAPQTSEPVYYPSVMENSPKDVSIIQINAADPDSKASDRLSYRITSGNPQGFFAINTKTGLVSTTSRKLDREQQDEHILEITITDHGVPPKTTTVRVIVQVLDDNDNRPLFLEKIYKIRLPERERPERERATKRDPVYRVIASDRDVGPNAEISYSIEEGDEHGKFFIEPKTGLVSSKKFSSAGEYDILTIKAVDNGRPQKSSTCRLHIEWIPKPEVPADAAPLRFEEFPFTFSVMESDPVAHMVGVVATESSDVPVWFEITGGNYDSRFDVGKASGTLIVARPLDAEQKSNYNLTVEATDGTRTVSTQVLIRVIDTNNHRPQFTQQVYVVNVPEDEPAGTEVLQISAVDRDEKNKLTYTLLSSTDPFSLRKFRLDPGTGVLFTTERLDHETMHRHILTVMVRDQDIPVKRNLVRVIVDVDDTNDNAPWFIGTPYSGQVFESAAIGSAVLQVTALDKDKGYNAEVIYSIESGNVGNSFAIDPVLGTITVAKELDCSSKSAFELVVKASDNGAPPLFSTVTVNIAVTVSDNAAPRFTEKEFSAEVSELAPPGSFVNMVTAISQSSVFYQIKGGNVHNVFDINPNSGVVVTQQPLDYETMSEYKLIIQGTNMAGLGTNTTLLVHLKDENDNAPVFSQREFKGVISELASINSVVLTHENTPFVIHASDADCDQNARLIYQIVEPFAHNYFAIDSSTGAIRSTAALDYEQRRVFRFTVQVHDLGMPRLFAETAANVTIEVIDVNDCPPLFSQELYEAAVIMPTYKGVEVVQVNATDPDSGPNSKLLFSISEGNIGDKFKIDPVTGIISIQNVTQLRSRYELKVRVSDGRFASAATAKVTVKENKENKRKFTQESYQAYIQENSSEKKTLAVITAVGNQVNEPLFYRILNPDNRFKVSSTSGVVSTTGIPFDREAQDSYDIIVEVTEEKKSEETAHILVTVTVEDVNDNKPMFVNLPYHALVQFDAEKGHIIRQVTAVDKDIGPNAGIHYSLKEPEDHFEIHPSGEILLKKKFEKDSLDTKFVLVVVARDNGKPPLSAEVEVPVTVVSKAMPVFERPFYSIEIPENIQLHSPVLHVQANDSEGPRIVYTITEGDPLKQFSIDFNTGVIHIIQPLDFERHPAYKLNIRATDSLTGAHSELFVDIILEDVNDNAPVFLSNSYYANISEAAVIGTSVLQVVARDSDTGNNKEVFYQLVEERGKSSDYFTIDRESGIISTSQVLDHEEVQQHKLRVRAVDGGVPALISDITVTVDVTDLNDNAPVFTQHTYQTTISELAPRGHFVSQVQASDADSSDVKKLVFSIIAGNEEQNFAINKQTGAIVISNHRQPHMQPFYNLTVAVSDGVFRNSAVVMVTVIGANFHNPTFSQTEYMVEVIENSPVGTLVAEAEATDDDEGIYGQITYHIVNKLAKDKFSINGKGEIFTLQSLDRENPVEKVISISLIAKDGGGKVGFCVVNVIVTDANDNSPQFRAAEYKATIASDAPRGTTVLKIAASDTDEGSNADIEYSIEADVGNVGENFEIHKTSGVIVTKESLIGLEDELYAFFVKAKDTGNPPRHSVVQVYIRIVSPELPLPKFAELYYRHTVAEDLPIGTGIDIIQAESEQPVVYSLVRGSTPESNEDEVFVVDRDTGALKLEKRLDHETAKWYQLTLLAQTKHETSEIVASVNVNIQVKDVNDNKPIFEADPYEAITVENLPSGTQVIQVKATDLDSGTNGHVVYSLDPTQTSQEIFELFAVSSETGWVTTLKELDREKTEKYVISVLATDQGDAVQHVTSTSVEVTVADVNDNPPRFTAEIYKGTVSEDDPPPSGVIAILSTTDEDSEDMNKQVNYFITGGFFSSLLVSAIINIDISDVNDNPPLFSQGNYSLIIQVRRGEGGVISDFKQSTSSHHTSCDSQENRPKGTSILQLAVSDRDASHNGPPFTFAIVKGNEGGVFHINQQGALVTTGVLSRKTKEHYLLQAQVSDSGKPQLSSTAFISVRIIEESVYPPAVLPLDIFVSVAGDEYPGGVLGKIHATDQDIYDTLTYSLAAPASTPADESGALFSVSASDGKIIALRPLDVGQYPLNVTVTDGRFTTPADVNVQIRQATRQALDNSIAVRFGSIAPEEFIGDYWRNFQRALRNIAGVRRSEVQLVSLQPEQGDLDVLLTLERSGSPYQSQELNSSAAMIEDMIGVRIVRVVQKLCVGLDCPLHFCDEVISLDKTAMSTYSTARLSFVTPRHVRTATCQCDGGKCPVLNNLCENGPCPEGMDCVADPRDTVYSCVCPEAKKGKCSDGHSLTFSGNGYVKYRLMENDNKELMKLSLRLRTFSSHATVMYAKGTDYSILEIVNGRLQYKFDCGSGPGLVSVLSAQVNDGEWHSVSLEVDGNYAKLVLDQVHAASGTAPGTLRTLNLDNNIYFGGHVRQHSSQRLGRSLPVTNGLRGCMEAMALNGLELPLNSRARRVQAVLEDMVDVAPGCALAPEESCSSNPCTNGGSCVSLANGGYFCKCPSSFMGSQCELAISPCTSNPCLYGGTCVPRADDFYCQCRGQYSGQRCQLGPYCRDNPCKNSGTCIDSLDGPVCECVAGFQGDRCLSDVDECIKNPCANGGQCQNTYGSFKCNCSLGFRGQKCDLLEEVQNQFVSTPWNIGLEEVIGIVVFVFSIFILVLLFIIIRKRACRSKSKTGGADKHPGGSGVPHSFLQRPYFDSKLNKNIYSDIPPQVPVRPISYTPSIPSDSRNNLDRNSFEGSTIPEHPEFTTFNPDSVHGHRKTVAVCSVAPNLPPPPPSNSVSDSDSIQKPNWDYDYDTKVVDLDPCLTKKPVEESACHLYNTRGSMSEVHSLSSFQSESCDDNGYHWDTSDWMPSVQLPGIQEFPHYEVVESPAPQYNDPSAMDTDYYPGGFDIESDFPPPPEDFPVNDDLPPPPLPEYGDTLRSLNRELEKPGSGSSGRRRPARPQLYSLNQYLPHHSYPSSGGCDTEGQGASSASATVTPASTVGNGGYRGEYALGCGRDFDSSALDDMSMSLYASTASCSDMSACCEESEAMMSDYESGEEGHFEQLTIPMLNPQQHTEV
uniref:Uncharacterized protein n=1 Tax=Xiphophorus couchianus TaxID=32473 RepID=A0A3B5L9E8_9TELE